MPSRFRSDELITGVHAVEELVFFADGLVKEVIVSADARGAVSSIVEAAKLKGIEVRVLSADVFKRTCGRHGIAARLSHFRYADPDELLQTASDPMSVLVALDSVQDPQNLGSILRTGAFFGVKGVFVPKDRAALVTPSVIRASAGAAFRVPVALVTNLARTIRVCNERGIVTIGATAKGGQSIRSIPQTGPYLLVLGSESAGLRRLVRESCDVLVTIESQYGFESLNVGVAAGILLHTIRVLHTS